MRKLSFFAISLLLSINLWAQHPLRPDAFPPIDEPEPKESLLMATTVEQMASWNRYPTYETYVEMMQQFAVEYPTLCKLDTIGYSVNNRLILCAKISDNVALDEEEPEFFYSSTMHGDELTGFHHMLHLIDTLLRSYGINEELTELINTTEIFINPLSNPDGTYYGGNDNVARSQRYNAHNIDLNRNYPDPFHTSNPTVEPENTAMIAYVSTHHFLLSANLHGGSEVINYPWDSFTSSQRPHPERAWWIDVSKRFVDTCRLSSRSMFFDVTNNGYIAGGDWYVISNGRQDYMNYYHNIREITMELSSQKRLSSDRLPHYWHAQSPALINYIKEIHTLEPPIAIDNSPSTANNFWVYPNPTHGKVTVETPTGSLTFDLSNHPAGCHILNINGINVKIIKL